MSLQQNKKSMHTVTRPMKMQHSSVFSINGIKIQVQDILLVWHSNNRQAFDTAVAKKDIFPCQNYKFISNKNRFSGRKQNDLSEYAPTQNFKSVNKQLA